jgi:hypothetical protein
MAFRGGLCALFIKGIFVVRWLLLTMLIGPFAAATTGPCWAGGPPLYWENGNFDIPAPVTGGFAIVDTAQRYGEWRVVGAPGNVSWVNGAYTHNGFSFAGDLSPTDNWVNLAAISRTATGIMHGPVPTTVGSSYTLTFAVGNLVDPTGIYGTSSTVLVYENAKLIATATNSDGGGTKTENWKSFSVTFAADAPYTEIAFINGDPPNDMNCGIGNTNFGLTAPSAQPARKAASHAR